MEFYYENGNFFVKKIWQPLQTAIEDRYAHCESVAAPLRPRPLENPPHELARLVHGIVARDGDEPDASFFRRWRRELPPLRMSVLGEKLEEYAIAELRCTYTNTFQRAFETQMSTYPFDTLFDKVKHALEETNLPAVDILYFVPVLNLPGLIAKEIEDFAMEREETPIFSKEDVETAGAWALLLEGLLFGMTQNTEEHQLVELTFHKLMRTGCPAWFRFTLAFTEEWKLGNFSSEMTDQLIQFMEIEDMVRIAEPLGLSPDIVQVLVDLVVVANGVADFPVQGFTEEKVKKWRTLFPPVVKRTGEWSWFPGFFDVVWI